MPKGSIKWYSPEKGYGFIASKENNQWKDYFFHVTEVRDEFPPNQGDRVSFTIKYEKERYSAKDVTITERMTPEALQKKKNYGNTVEWEKSSSLREDSRDRCINCNKLMVPRIQFKDGEPYARICPFCMKSQEKEGCFIATEVFDDFDHPTVRTLRELRDQSLRMSMLGRNFIII